MSGDTDDSWVGRLMAGRATAPLRAGLDARVAVLVEDQRSVLRIRGGRVGVDESGDEAEAEVPLSASQAEAVATGELSLAVAYMRGDVKPVGSSGALAVFLEVVEDPATWTAWRPSP